MTPQDDSEFLHHIPCDNCGSSDAGALYSDGHTFCHACQHWAPGEGEAPAPAAGSSGKSKDLLQGEIQALTKRHLKEETCRKFRYMTGTFKGKAVQIAPYFDASNQMVGQKIRFPDKDFLALGDCKTLFGQNLWNSGKRIVITEGEIDAMSVSQLQDNKWPVVSVPNGAAGAKKAIARNMEYLEGFQEVVLMFDMDEPGREAAQECAELFSPGRCKIATLPFKDANECLQKGQGAAVVAAIWSAKAYRPDGLVNALELREKVLEPIVIGLPWFLKRLTEVMFGRRNGEIYGLGAGTGIGKTDFLTQQIAYDIITLKQRVGTIYLEQPPKETLKRIAGKVAGRRFHVPDGSWTPDELIAAVDTIGDSLIMYDSFGETEWDVVKGKIRFMVQAEGIKLIYLDHLTAMADPDDEKGSLEKIMRDMATLAMELDCVIHFISHLTTPDNGPPHEEGGRVTIRQFKGSRSIGFWSHFMFGMERNQQHENPELRQVTTFRVLKDRNTGQAAGEVIYLGYDKDKGHLVELEGNPFEDVSPFPAESNNDF